MDKKVILSIEDLEVSFHTYAGKVEAVRGVSFEVLEGEALAIVGESGCGKSVTAQTILKLNPMPPAKIEKGKIILDDIDVVKATEKEMRDIRGNLASMVFQDPMTSLNPTMTVGKQVGEILTLRKGIKKKDALNKSADILSQVRIANAESRAKQYPNQYSGGMRQRAMIGMAITGEPKLIIADEPTTALDVTIQALVLDLLRSIQKATNTSIIIITHDLGVAASIAQRVAVMYAGKIVEIGTASDIFHNPKHPYTWGLMDSMPKVNQNKDAELCAIEGTPPSLINPPKGCGFANRCKYCMKICEIKEPESFELDNNHKCSCWLLHEDAPNVTRIKVGDDEGGK